MRFVCLWQWLGKGLQGGASGMVSQTRTQGPSCGEQPEAGSNSRGRGSPRSLPSGPPGPAPWPSSQEDGVSSEGHRTPVDYAPGLVRCSACLLQSELGPRPLRGRVL